MLAVVPVGYLEYAWSLFFQKDQLKTKVRIESNLEQPTLSRDEVGFQVVLPEPIVQGDEEERTISFLGYQFLGGKMGKLQVAKLFKACVFHLSAHIATSNFEAYSMWEKNKDGRLAKFVESLVEDAKVNAYIFAGYPDKLVEVAFANSLAFKRLKSLERIWNPATRVMAASLLQANVGEVKGDLRMEERETVSQVMNKLGQFRETVMESLAGEEINMDNVSLKAVDEIYLVLERYGPVLEVPSFPHTEKLDRCTLFPQCQVQQNDMGEIFGKCLTTLGAEGSGSELQQTMWAKAVETEALQVFDSWTRDKEKNEKVLSRYDEMIFSTRFKSIEIPPDDYTQYLRAKVQTKSATRRLIDSLMVAFDALDEDPRKMYGILDIQDIIQVMAAKGSRTDVFMRDENISKSHAWVILLDVSRSMSPVADEVRNFGICLAECAKEMLIDPTSWGLYAFNDRFLILKDPNERYGPRIKARIGGLKFEGLTYMPDALQLAAEILKSRAESLRIITILSDGWPYGYSQITSALAETTDFLQKKSINVIGLGVGTDRMKNYFRVNCNVQSMRDLSKGFSNLFLEACRGAVGL